MHASRDLNSFRETNNAGAMPTHLQNEPWSTLSQHQLNLETSFLLLLKDTPTN